MERVTSQSMDEMSPKFTCSICCKGFENKRSQIRHSSYCRKKARNPPKPRKRSCVSCADAKTLCDSDFPSCSRCLKRNVTCLYNQLSKPGIGLSEQQQLQTVISPSEITPSLDLFSDSSLLQYYGESVSHEPQDFNLASYHLFQTPDTFGNPHLLPATSTNIPERDHASLALISQGERSSENLFFADRRYSMDFSSIETFNPLWMEPVLPAPKAFWPRRLRYRQLSLNKKYVICTLAAYPHMMLQGKGMPPFMHPQCAVSEYYQDGRLAQTSLPEPLVTCAGIIAMWSVKNRYNTVFIWRAIRIEQERLSEECFRYDDWDAVAALQAICIYFLLRVSEKDDDATDFDIPLIHTMTKLAQRVKGISLKHCRPSNDRPPTWGGWILAESLRRTLYVLFIVDLLFDISPGTNFNACHTTRHLAEMLLPCTKNLWNAQTKSEWEREYTAQSNVQGLNKHQRLTFSDLVQHDVEVSSFGNALDRWLAHVDEFGTLVIAAASLLEGAEYSTP